MPSMTFHFLTLDDLRAGNVVRAAPGCIVMAVCRTAIGDEEGGFYLWDEVGATDDDESLIVPGGTPRVSVGPCWRRVYLGSAFHLSNAHPQDLGTAAEGVANEASRSDHVHAHGNLAGGSFHSAATPSVAGFMAAADKSKTDLLTSDGGVCVWITNKTGVASVKGTVVCIYDAAATDLAFQLAPVGADDCFGVVYDAGVADGSLCRVVIGGIAEVLVEAGDTIQRRYWVRSPTATAGRASISSTIGGGSVAEHFKEVGHCLETKVNGGSTLAKCVIHFN